MRIFDKQNIRLQIFVYKDCFSRYIKSFLYYKVWHQGLLLKLKHNAISKNLLKIINRYQKVILNGQVSKWASVNAGVPQGSIFGLLLFLIYINNSSNVLSSNPRLFSDDISFFSIVRDRKCKN